ncbi:MAG: hypothetical protein FJ090_03820 [Deltaproteobacteria bacterium]|nr:hypothetical protein [Deltaproteobacteria bacterium]
MAFPHAALLALGVAALRSPRCRVYESADLAAELRGAEMLATLMSSAHAGEWDDA